MRSFIVTALAFASAVAALPADLPKPSGVSLTPSGLSAPKLSPALVPKYPNATIVGTPVATKSPILPTGALLSPPPPQAPAIPPKIVPTPVALPKAIPPVTPVAPPPAPQPVHPPVSVPAPPPG